MKNVLLSALLICSNLPLEGSLRNLIDYDKLTCLEQLEKAGKEELWDAFLDGQARLFFDSEIKWIANQDWFQQAKNVLEIGSGNGAYLSKLAERFHDKTFHGIEKLPLSVVQSIERYSKEGIKFDEGDAEVFNDAWVDSSDIVLFRLTLQHLENPLTALQHAWYYLTPEGYVLIIDACDLAKKTSHPILEVDKTLTSVSQLQKENGHGNRRITLELLTMLENQQYPVSDLYEVAFSNIDSKGNLLHESLCLQGEENRRLYFNHGLLFLKILSLTYQLPVDLSAAYDELHNYLEDENAWVIPGMHLLVLKKRNSIRS